MKILYLNILFALSLLGFCACDDGDSFTDSPSNLLSFSVDTVRFDTIFSTVPSSTRSFWVHNRSGKGLRCTNVRLEGGNQSGYRVNVDGVYLSPEQGYKANDIEVRDKDSIRVFVELTSNVTFTDKPKEINDNLVFTLESGRQQKVVLNAFSWDATLLKDVTIGKDSTLASSGKPMVVYGGLTVEEGATLTLAAGTTLYFHGNAGMTVKGRLLSKGTEEANVVLRGDRLDRMFDYLPYDRVSGQWQGIRFEETSYDNEMTYTDLHGAFNGIVADSSDVSRNKLTLANSTVHNCQGDCVRLVNAKASIVNCQLTNALGHCLAVDGGEVSVQNSTLAQFYPFDASRGTALYFSATDNPLLALECRNSLVTGYSDDEMTGVHGGEDNENAFNYMFYDCVMRTPEAEDEEQKKHFTNVVFEDVKDTVSYGQKHFVKIDGDQQDYDFHLRKESAAIDKANPETATKTDRDGRSRDEKPDVGAYEYVGGSDEE